MKTIFILCGLLLVAGVAVFFFLRPATDHYGNEFRGYAAVDIAPLVDRPADFLKKDATIRGTLGRQCPSSGCWFYLRDAAGKEVKVEMGDTTPKLPQRVGKTATVEGRLIRFGEGYEFVGTAVEFR
jgi:hypothetical protein